MNDQSFLQYFTQINSQEGIFLWMVMLVSFLLGFLIAYLLRSSKVRRLKKENKQMASDLQAAETQLASAQEQLKQRNLELQEESREKVDLMDRVSTLEQERQQKLQEVVNLNQQLEHLQAENRQHEQTILQLQSQATSTDTDTDEPSSTTPQHFAQEGSVSAKEVAALQDRLSSFEHTLNRLQQENAQLRTDLRDLKDHQHTTTNTGNTSAPVAPSTPEEPEDLQIETKKTVLYDKIIVPDREQDDLTRIEGIGDFIAKKLNSNGIFTYAEIASWTPDRIKTVTEAIGYIPGRIEKDNWVGQAALLLQQQMDGTVIPTPAEARSVVVEEPQKDAAPAGMTEGDLKIIEGIGPKIEEVLKNAGINDWATLAGTEPGRLKEILEEAGDRFRMHNPYTWPLQARLAAAGRWEEFHSYQDELKGGKEK